MNDGPCSNSEYFSQSIYQVCMHFNCFVLTGLGSSVAFRFIAQPTGSTVPQIVAGDISASVSKSVLGSLFVLLDFLYTIDNKLAIHALLLDPIQCVTFSTSTASSKLIMLRAWSLKLIISCFWFNFPRNK